MTLPVNRTTINRSTMDQRPEVRQNTPQPKQIDKLFSGKKNHSGKISIGLASRLVASSFVIGGIASCILGAVFHLPTLICVGVIYAVVPLVVGLVTAVALNLLRHRHRLTGA